MLRYWQLPSQQLVAPQTYSDWNALQVNQRPTYMAYLLRLWQAEVRPQPVWHASLEDPHTGERRGFADLKSLWAFLEAQIANRDRNTDDDNLAG